MMIDIFYRKSLFERRAIDLLLLARECLLEITCLSLVKKPFTAKPFPVLDHTQTLKDRQSILARSCSFDRSLLVVGWPCADNTIVDKLANFVSYSHQEGEVCLAQVEHTGSSDIIQQFFILLEDGRPCRYFNSYICSKSKPIA